MFQKHLIGAALAAMLGLAVAGNATPAVAAYEPFVGEITFLAGSYCPKGWLPADGRDMPISQNYALFSLLGTRYGGNGTTTFRLPKLVNQVLALRSAVPPYSEVPLIACIAVLGVFPPRP